MDKCAGAVASKTSCCSRARTISGKLYNLEFEERIIPGWEIEEVKNNLLNC